MNDHPLQCLESSLIFPPFLKVIMSGSLIVPKDFFMSVKSEQREVKSS